MLHLIALIALAWTVLALTIAACWARGHAVIEKARLNDEYDLLSRHAMLPQPGPVPSRV